MLETLLGNYRVAGQLGEGGMGVVYIGHHETLGHRVAVKVLQPRLSSNADMVQRFFKEAQAATAIRNPGIVQVFDFGTTPDGRAYLVMELLEGETLTARLQQRRLDLGECCRIGRQIANVLQAAHAAGITHRDLKPDNLFLVHDAEVIGGERVKVLDFGIAKLTGDAHFSGLKTTTGLVMGTPSYMSPEQCRGIRNADARSDIYSLGCILFKMACGRSPFVGVGLGDIIGGHLYQPPPHPRDLVPDMHAGLSALIAKMLAKHPDARPQTMTAVSQAFDLILSTLGGPPAGAPKPSPVPDPSPPPHARISTPLSVPSWTTLDNHTTRPLLELSLTTLDEPAPPPVPVPLSPTATTIGNAARKLDIQPRSGGSPLPFVLGGGVIIGAVTAIVISLATTDAGSPERPPPGKPRSADVRAMAADAATPSLATIAADATEEPDILAAADELEAECRGYVVDRKWGELAQCAAQLRPLDPVRAAELGTRAVEEARSAPRIAAVEAALRDRNLRRARGELEQVWTGSVEFAKLERKYETAEAQATVELAAQLERVKDSDCEEYKALLAKERAVMPTRVTDEAARRTPCAPPPCDTAALTAKGWDQFAANRFAESLASYEAAYACRPAPLLVQRLFGVACTQRDAAKARSYWKRLSPAMRTQSIRTCERYGITAAQLDAP